MSSTGLSQVFDDQQLSDRNRPIRLRLGSPSSELNSTLLLQRAEISEMVCGGIGGHLTCISTRVDLPLQSLA